MLGARKLVGELKQANSKAKKLQQERCPITSESKESSQEAAGFLEGYSSGEGSVEIHNESEKTSLVHRSAKSATAYTKCATCGEIGSQCDQRILKNRIGMGNEGKYLRSSICFTVSHM